MLCAVAGFGAALAWPAARACEVQADHFRLLHPWTRATPHGAHSAVLCMNFEDVTRDDVLVGVETPMAAGVEAVGLPAAAGADASVPAATAATPAPAAAPPLAMPIPAGRPTAFTEDGLHLRLTGLKLPLHVGREYPLTLHFRESGVVMARLSVDFDAQDRFASPIRLR